MMTDEKQQQKNISYNVEYWFKKWIRFLEGSWNHEIGSLAKEVKRPEVFDSMNLPKIEFIANICILL